jgi:hypothetical protein
MPGKTERKIVKVGGSKAVMMDPKWLEFFEKDLKDNDNKVVMYSDSLVVIVPKGREDLEEKARKIVEGRD